MIHFYKVLIIEIGRFASKIISEKNFVSEAAARAYVDNAPDGLLATILRL